MNTDAGNVGFHCPPFFYRGDNICNCLCFTAQCIPSEEGSTLNGKNLLLVGVNSFFLKLDPFIEGRQNNADRVP